MTLNRRHLLAAAGAVGLPLHSFAQASITKFILPVSVGSGVDGIVRASSNQLGKALGTSVVVENQPGAGGIVGTQNLIKSAPDGNTLSFVSNNHVIYPSVTKNLSFDPVADITPIAIVAYTPLVLIVNAKFPARDLREFVAMLKKSPGKYNYASSGNGTILHLAPEYFKDVTGTFSTHIPYRGFAPMLQDIVSGQVDWGVSALPAALSQIKAGTVRALCIPMQQRSPAAPEIPTSTEAGVPQYQLDAWIACVGPKGLPTAQVQRINAAIKTAFATDEVKEAMAKQGNIVNISTPEFALEHFKKELVRYGALVKKAGVVPA
ncbi:tripartite tricarboxylate transporter substrate-binding protein [Variovorax sp. PCZ-1]|uniref:Bug family tripartite tricarboxylate transporter substrate binding protein n=1 Tax=Variovorax sp. PCZ-1 TaxID=2835533 RepID=UPI001BCB1CB5|nr:tripartite tricarboxylate transporter substrate-binding protein [Variovorax sp. PCZ-1]MBS7809051.1 tripartite tricarboxylate transporter substrate binding protein [Variovorax sp. PCZ-1]